MRAKISAHRVAAGRQPFPRRSQISGEKSKTAAPREEEGCRRFLPVGLREEEEAFGMGCATLREEEESGAKRSAQGGGEGLSRLVWSRSLNTTSLRRICSAAERGEARRPQGGGGGRRLHHETSGRRRRSSLSCPAIKAGIMCGTLREEEESAANPEGSGRRRRALRNSYLPKAASSATRVIIERCIPRSASSREVKALSSRRV